MELDSNVRRVAKVLGSGNWTHDAVPWPDGGEALIVRIGKFVLTMGGRP